MIKVSQELFLEIRDFKEFDFNYTYNVITKELERGLECFYFICKEWAYIQGFRIIEIDTDLFWVVPKKYSISYSFNYGMILSEHITFFEACQWILDNKEL